MHGEQDTVLRLRREADAVTPELRDGQVDDVLTTVFTRRARQRAQRTRIWAIAAVVLVVAGAGLFTGLVTHRSPELGPATSVENWPLRGKLAGDTALLARAEKVWRTPVGPDAPVGPVRALFADHSPQMPVNTVMVVLSGHTATGRSVVAFVTSLATDGIPDSERLFVRAVAFPEASHRAVGFVAGSSHPSDILGGAWGRLAFALAAPGTSGVKIRSSVVEDSKGENEGEVFWGTFPPGAGAWNSVIVADDEAHWSAAGMVDPVATPITMNGAGNTMTGRSTTERKLTSGDLVMSELALYGIVVDVSGRVDTSPAAWLPHGTVHDATSNVPGTLTVASENSLLFTPTGSGELKVGDRITFTSAVNPDVVVNVGKLVNTRGQWQVHRWIPPGYTPEELMSVSPGSFAGQVAW